MTSWRARAAAAARRRDDAVVLSYDDERCESSSEVDAAAAGSSDAPLARTRLDTLVIDEQVDDIANETGQTDPTDTLRNRLAWLQRCGWLTFAHRTRRAAYYERRAVEKVAELRELGASQVDAERIAWWYRSRGVGAVYRFVRAVECGDFEERHTLCQCCDERKVSRLMCSARFVCGSCRKLWVAKRANMMRRAFRVVMKAGKRARLHVDKRHGGAWGLRFITCGLPQYDGETEVERIERYHRTVKHFMRAFREELKKLQRATFAPIRPIYAKGDEWTPGSFDGKGNPHLHALIYSPFLPKERLRELWARAVNKHSRVKYATAAIVVDIKAGDESSFLELSKYVVKDVVSTTTVDGVKKTARVHEALFAKVYEGYDGHRTQVWTRGLVKLAKVAPCKCGENALLTRIVRAPRDGYGPVDATAKPGDEWGLDITGPPERRRQRRYIEQPTRYVRRADGSVRAEVTERGLWVWDYNESDIPW